MKRQIYQRKITNVNLHHQSSQNWFPFARSRYRTMVLYKIDTFQRLIAKRVEPVPSLATILLEKRNLFPSLWLRSLFLVTSGKKRKKKKRKIQNATRANDTPEREKLTHREVSKVLWPGFCQRDDSKLPLSTPSPSLSYSIREDQYLNEISLSLSLLSHSLCARILLSRDLIWIQSEPKSLSSLQS